MNIQISHNDYHNLKVFLNSKQIESFFATPQNEQKEKSFIYFARYGKSFDGHQFAKQIIDSKNFIVGERKQIIKQYLSLEVQNKILNSEFFIKTDNIEHALKTEFKKIADIHKLNFMSIGITGTSGKTSSVQISGNILSKLLNHKILKMGTLGVEIGNTILSNSHLTTPDYPAFINALNLAKQEQINTLIMEVSSHGLEEARLYDYKFDIAVFTNFSQDHLDFHKSMENYLKAKTLLFSKHLKQNSTCIVSTQSPEWKQIVEQCTGTERTLYILSSFSHCDSKDLEFFKSNFKNTYFVQIDERNSTIEGLSGKIKLTDSNKTLLSENYFTSPLIGEINFENIMIAFSVCLASGFTEKDFVTQIPEIKNISGRMQKVYPANGSLKKPTIIVDYSHKPGALKSVITTLKNLCPPSKKLITVFGCGGDRDTQKRPMMGQIASELSDITIITSDNPRTEDPKIIIDHIISGIPNHNHVFIEPDRRLAIQKAFEIAEESDIILIAGKGDETYQIIGTQKHNFSDVLVAESFLNGG